LKITTNGQICQCKKISLSVIIVKCPNCDYEFHSAFRDDEVIAGINIPCPKCANSFDIEYNQK